nr:MAG TPA: hypothetical protein [Caudoviricetes sp.]
MKIKVTEIEVILIYKKVLSKVFSKKRSCIENQSH